MIEFEPEDDDEPYFDIDQRLDALRATRGAGIEKMRAERDAALKQRDALRAELSAIRAEIEEIKKMNYKQQLKC